MGDAHLIAPRRLSTSPAQRSQLPLPADVTWTHAPMDDSVFPAHSKSYRSADKGILTDSSSSDSESKIKFPFSPPKVFVSKPVLHTSHLSEHLHDRLDKSLSMSDVTQSREPELFQDVSILDLESHNSAKRKEISPSHEMPETKSARHAPASPPHSALADLGRAVFWPFTRSLGVVPDLPLPSFPLESKAHSKRLDRPEETSHPSDTSPTSPGCSPPS